MIWPGDPRFDHKWPRFELDRGISKTNILIKFHKNTVINMTSRELTKLLRHGRTFLWTDTYVVIRKAHPVTMRKMNQKIAKVVILFLHIELPPNVISVCIKFEGNPSSSFLVILRIKLSRKYVWRPFLISSTPSAKG
jgi:hypothetical protein